MASNKNISYLYPVLSVIFILLSNFLSPEIFESTGYLFAVWFAISFLQFGMGWITNKYFDWGRGTTVLLSVTISASILTLVLVTLMNSYFTQGTLLFESLIMYLLRVILLSSMGLFGFAVSEIYKSKKEFEIANEKLKVYSETIGSSKREAELILREAQLKATQIVSEAETTSKNLLLKKERIERELKEFIQIEKELIKKYEE